MEKIPVFIVDDQNLFRQSLALLINSVNNFELSGDFNSASSFLKSLTGIPKDQTYVALVDIDMPVMNGIELNKILHEQYPQIKVIILSVHVNTLLITKMIDARASAYLAKNCNKDELITAIQSVHKTGFYFNREVLKAFRENVGYHSTQVEKNPDNLPIKLTDRDKQIIKLICQEHNNVEIGKKLYLSPRTIEGHRINLLTKTGCRNTAGLVLFAIKYGLFPIPK
jgi:DNA-binding NarL/FixJ family response regulator